jgi:hypothetical protein
MFKFMSFCMILWLNFWANITTHHHPVHSPVNRPVRRAARSTGLSTGSSGLQSGRTGLCAGLPSSSHNLVKTLGYMLCLLVSLFIDDMYTYPIAILALFC